MAEQASKSIINGLKDIEVKLQEPSNNLNAYVKFVEQLRSSQDEHIQLQQRGKHLEEMKSVIQKNKIKDETGATIGLTQLSVLQTKIENINS